jgi:hypothetical protein
MSSSYDLVKWPIACPKCSQRFQRAREAVKHAQRHEERARSSSTIHSVLESPAGRLVASGALASFAQSHVAGVSARAFVVLSIAFGAVRKRSHIGRWRKGALELEPGFLARFACAGFFSVVVKITGRRWVSTQKAAFDFVMDNPETHGNPLPLLPCATQLPAKPSTAQLMACYNKHVWTPTKQNADGSPGRARRSQGYEVVCFEAIANSFEMSAQAREMLFHDETEYE